MKYPTQMPKPWKEIDRRTLMERYGRGLEEVTFCLPDGRKESYVLKKERPTVAIFALTREMRIILIEQFRPGPKKVLCELPGGYIDKGESPFAAARRELLEETGYTGSLKPLFHYHDCAYSSRIRHYFLATQCRVSPTIYRKLSSNEKFNNIVLVPLKTWVKTMYKNPPTDMACVLAALRTLKQ